MGTVDTSIYLVARAGALLCALPISSVIETMRPLPVMPLTHAPEFVAGTSVIRGEPVPVVDATRFLGATNGQLTRFIVVRAGDRKVALAVQAVLGIHHLNSKMLAGIPPLLSRAGTEAIAAIAALDKDLLFVLQAAHVVPEEVWNSMDQGAR